jgi:hypothetical protein
MLLSKIPENFIRKPGGIVHSLHSGVCYSGFVKMNMTQCFNIITPDEDTRLEC